MYINKPLLRGTSTRRSQRPATDFIKSQKKNVLPMDVQEIETSWQKLMKSMEEQIIRAHNDQAYHTCCNLLEKQFEEEEKRFNKVRRHLKVGIQTVEEHVEVCTQERKEKKDEKEVIEDEIKDFQVEIAKENKRKKKHEELRSLIEEQRDLIQIGNQKLQQSKEKSYQQKNLYLQAQESEMNLLDEVQKVEDEEKVYYQYRAREEKYRQLSKILEKLHSKSTYSNKDIQSYLKDKIDVMSSLRTNLISIEEKLEEFETIIEEQRYIIEGLKYKSEQMEQYDDSLYNRYREKYSDLYFNRNNDLDNWRNYKNYLEELLKRNKIDPHLSTPEAQYKKRYQNIISRGQRDKSKSSYIRAQPQIYEIQEEPQIKHIRTPQAKHKSGQYVKNPQSVKLPKLVKMGGDNEQQGKIKENLKKNIKNMMNQSDISLESVDSNDENLSGQFIEVQFHKK